MKMTVKQLIEELLEYKMDATVSFQVLEGDDYIISEVKSDVSKGVDNREPVLVCSGLDYDQLKDLVDGV